MKIRLNPELILFSLLLAAVAPLAAADDLGRLFFTSSQRQALDNLRQQGPAEKKTPEIVIEVEPEITGPEKPERPVVGGIYVNGLVYRENGKSTAWVNRANTNQGDLGHRYLDIDPGTIGPEEVEILIPSADKKVKLKVGEFYDPEDDQAPVPEK